MAVDEKHEMRILAAADIHGALSVYEWLMELAGQEKADLLILVGDLLAGDSEEQQREQSSIVVRVLRTCSVPVLYLMGNDDLVPLAYEDERMRPLHGRAVRIGIHAFVGYEYSLPFVGGPFEKPESEIERDALALEPLLGPTTVFVSHSPAFGILDATAFGTHAGSRSLAALLARKPPLAHIHGHVHEAFGRSGQHFNVASAGMRRAMCINLPSLEHRILRA